jgi:hypothetical protein
MRTWTALIAYPNTDLGNTTSQEHSPKREMVWSIFTKTKPHYGHNRASLVQGKLIAALILLGLIYNRLPRAEIFS